MTNSPELSILMSIYNAEPFLEACLESIVSQSYTKWELLVADDFSHDRSVDILAKFATQDSRIKIHQHANKGLIPALSYLEPHINGKLVTRMDADDLMPTNKLEKLVGEAKKHGPGAVITGKVKYFSSGKFLNEGYLNYESWLNSLIDQQDFWSDIYKECVIASPNWVIHKSDLELCGGICSERYPEDYDLCFRWYLHQLKVVGVDHVSHLWRDHSLRTSRHSELYRDNTFLSIKAHYFSLIDAQKHEHIVLMGAGKKGKTLAQCFDQRGLKFSWVSNNKKKTGHIIHGHELQDVNSFKFEVDTAVIVATTQDREEISELCGSLQMKPYYFC